MRRIVLSGVAAIALGLALAGCVPGGQVVADDQPDELAAADAGVGNGIGTSPVAPPWWPPGLPCPRWLCGGEPGPTDTSGVAPAPPSLGGGK
jgi:hypothetical protein